MADLAHHVRYVNFYPPCDPCMDPHPWRTTSWLTYTDACRNARQGAIAIGVRVVFEGRHV